MKLAFFRGSVLLALSGLFAYYVLRSHLSIENEQAINPQGVQSSFSWAQLSPSPNLEWTDCELVQGVKLQCARLQVPLNYSDPNGISAAIAMTRIPASVSPESADYRGPLLMNPGGPGGSGVDLILRSGGLLQSIVGPQFDILGFDPRGVGHSTPGFQIYESNVERLLVEPCPPGPTELNETTGSLSQAWATSIVVGKLAQNRTSEVLPFIHTDHTARDMMEIVKAHGRENINYWGVSYGTILGGTFASMFPDKIERLIIDGVLDSDNYFHGRWDDNLIDTDATLQEFFDSCHIAGPELCAFYAPSPDAISANLANIYDQLQIQPIPVLNEDGRYAVISYEYLRSCIFASLYKPYVSWPPLATALSDLLLGDGRKALELNCNRLPLEPTCEQADSKFASGPEVTVAIACNDAYVSVGDYTSIREHFKHLFKMSEWASIWEKIHLMCSGWPQINQPRFQGPIGASNTSYPILIIGNRHDPVTPWTHANKTHARFPGSALLSQNSPGHSSISAPSPCTHRYIREYLVNGTLPEPGTWCEPSRRPFDPELTNSDLNDNKQTHFTHSRYYNTQLAERAVKEIKVHGIGIPSSH